MPSRCSPASRRDTTVAVEPAVDGSRRAGARIDARDAVALDQVVRRYGERAALRRVTLRLEPGRTLAVFGPNGAGKTTLLRMLATLLVPHEGELRVLGHRLPRDAHRVRPRIGLLAHEPLLYRDLSGRENLALLRPPVRRRRAGGAYRPPARGDRHDSARRRAGAQPLARHGAANRRSAARCCIGPSCCCWTSRARTSTRRPPRWRSP